MDLKKLSASALNVADMCLARYYADTQAGYGASIRNNYARLGSSVHGPLEDFVRVVYIEKKIESNLGLLEALYNKHYQINFETADLSGDWYDMGLEMLRKWFNRTDFSYFQVVSVEQKKYFSVKTSIGEIPVTYIIDRLDYLGDGVYRVTDYKTSNEILTPDLLFKKIQAKVYALSQQIELKDSDPPVKEIWVEFDMLRFSPVQVCFTRDDSANSYRMLQRAAERIIEAKVENDEDLKKLETLNPQCGFCIRKATCDSILKNMKVGGTFTYTTLEEMVNARALFEYQMKAAKAAMEELNPIILAQMEHDNLFEFETGLVDVKIDVGKTRVFDVDQIMNIIGEKRFFELGGRRSITAKDFDALCKVVSPSEAALLKSDAVTYNYSNPRINAKIKGDFSA